MVALGSLAMVAASLGFASLVTRASAGAFLRPHTEKSVSLEVVQQTLLSALLMDVDTLHKVEDELRPMYAALPKNEHGTLEPSVVRYALHRHFAHKHGWYIKGLESSSPSSNMSSLASISKDGAPEYIQGLLEERMKGHGGWKLRELAISSTAIMALIQREVIQDLEFVYNLLGLTTASDLGDEGLDSVVEAYLAQYIVDDSFVVQDVPGLITEVEETYDAWPDLVLWAQDMRRSLDFAAASRRNPFVRVAPTFDGLVELAQEITRRYSSFQNFECSFMTDVMLDLEYHNTGRVPLASFYHSGVDGPLKFWEPREYLKHTGVLDESEPAHPMVIVPNYVYGKNNCLASSSFYSVCCPNKCERLMGDLEHALAAPSAPPQRIEELVSGLSSDTVDAPRRLSENLLSRLSEIAELHGGEVPLHGRLFSQWLHHAYPRECPFPQVESVSNVLMPEAWSLQTGQDYLLDTQQMRSHVRSLTKSGVAHSTDMPWAPVEELVGVHVKPGGSFAAVVLRRGMAFAAVIALALPLLEVLKRVVGSAAEPEAGKLGKHHLV